MNHTPARSPNVIDFARRERATANELARTVWQFVRNRQICNQKFRREHPIPPYTADFCCIDLKLILEIDGADHFTATGQDRDRARDDFLNDRGYRVVRIPGYDVLRDARQVRETIVEEVKKRTAELAPHPQPLSPPRGEGGQKNTILRSAPLAPVLRGEGPGVRGFHKVNAHP